ncbi:MAG: endopeptidase La [Clostridia bacterium]|nr:endopeptidase La [Clostridia bacterium]
MEKEKIKIRTLPIIPLRERVIFPDTIVTVDAERECSVKAIAVADERDKMVFVCAQRNETEKNVRAEDLYLVGCVCQIKRAGGMGGLHPNRITVEALYRAEAKEISLDDGCFYAECEKINPIHDNEMLEEAFFRTARAIVRDIQQSEGRLAKEVWSQLETCCYIERYINIAAGGMRIRKEIKQELLAEKKVVNRLRLFETCLNDELEITKLERKISATVRKNIDQSQKEYYLREQMRAIRKELGDDEDEREELKKKILGKNLPEAVEKKALKELSRMDKMQVSSPEFTVIRTYLDWVLDLPWAEQTTDTELLSDCVRVLEEDHYGLEKIKERITEYLAVLKLTGSMKAPILCFVGPPGVGKTSIAQSIARALGRKFVRMSLGGVKDEAEIRGHRRTYIGSMPGRILYAMKEAETINPVFLLDEIDKVSSDMRGDPASALLEVLDPEQNATFRDRFLEEAYDLSKVLFIATANTLDTIPGPLRDRMEIIELNGYTMNEKREIAKRYLCPKKIKENGLSEEQVFFTDEALTSIIDDYTLEAGVRNLERHIGTVCRKIAVTYADNKDMEKVTVDGKSVEKYLGAKKHYKEDKMLASDEVGAATGLAWTAYGGTTLTVEVALSKGKGDLRLTGKLGDVMKESAQAALTYIHSHAKEYGLDSSVFENTDIHVHVPEGATPKDGPSAGITIATAILSAFTQKPVRRDIAMTGEITLRGKVLPIGGLKEKALAAHRIGIKNVIIPNDNARDLDDVPETVREEMNFIIAENVQTVFFNAILGI